MVLVWVLGVGGFVVVAVDFLMSMGITPAYVAMHQKPEKGVRYPRPEGTSGCKPPCRHWELDPGFLKEQSVLLITEPSPASAVGHFRQGIKKTT